MAFMKNFIWIYAISGVLFLGGISGGPNDSFAAQDAFQDSFLGFPEYPKAQLLCSEHVSGVPFHILWRSFSTPADVGTVVAFYEQQMSTMAKAGEHGAFTITHPKDANLLLTVFTKENAAHFPNCKKKPDATARSLILVSKAMQ